MRPFNVARYRKALVATGAAVVIILSQVVGVAVDQEDADTVVGVFDAVVAALSAFGVLQVPNDHSPVPPSYREEV